MMSEFDNDDVNSVIVSTLDHSILWQLPEQLEKSDPSYKFNEDCILAEVKKYINDTYKQHYAQTKFQATEFILDGGHGDGFCIGNILKYAQRYGKKDGYNRKDLLKIIHYAIIALHNHDINERK
jgi:hypothetical protein